MDEQSLWLGPLRRPLRFLAIGLIAAMGLVWLWLVIGILFFGSDVSMSTVSEAWRPC